MLENINIQTITGLGDSFHFATDEFKVHVQQFIEGTVKRRVWLDASNVPPPVIKEMSNMPRSTLSKESLEPLHLLPR